MTGCCYVDVRDLREDGSREDVFSTILFVRPFKIEKRIKTTINLATYWVI